VEVDDRPLVWDRANRKHLSQDHPERRISLSDVEEVLSDPGRDDRYDPLRDNHPVLGRTRAGRWLIVVSVNHPRGRYPIHARPVSPKVRRMWQKP
jgi:hypothetical protein